MYLYQRYLRSGIKSRFPHSFLTDAIIELKDWYSIKLIDNEHQFDLNSLWILIYQTRGRRVDLPLPFLIERDHQATCIKSSPSLPPIQRKNPTRPHPERPDPFPARSIPRQHHSQSVTNTSLQTVHISGRWDAFVTQKQPGALTQLSYPSSQRTFPHISFHGGYV